MSAPDSHAIELAPIREMLRMYCRALCERSVDLQDVEQLVNKNIGWSRNDVATSDGTAIFVPAAIERFEAQADNFEFLKVMLTQQAGHLEFGSFEFQFDRPSTKFRDLRPRLSRGREEAGAIEKEASPTEFSRFFRLFANKRLALDIFAIVETARVEVCVVKEYRGIAPVYRTMRERALALRQEIVFLPAREALLELMIRLSLGQTGSIRVPAQHLNAAAMIGQRLQSVAARDATVEDAAEATLRLYALTSDIANDYLDEDQFVAIELEEDLVESSSRSSGSNRSSRWQDEDESSRILTRPSAAVSDRDYLSPQGVDYRGEFKPELAQLLIQAQANSSEQRKSLTPEELAQLLRNQRGRRSKDCEEEGEQQDPQTNRMAQNLVRELERRDPRMQSVEQRPWLQADDDAGPLAATQPDTFVYDEWDAFANRYRARWCRVFEKVMGVGDLTFYRDTLVNHAGLLQQIRREFEQVVPELYRKEKRLQDGVEPDLDAAIEAMTDRRIGVSPAEKIFWRQRKAERDVAVAFLVDMSGSTGETIAGSAGAAGFARRSEPYERPQRRVIDVEKEAIVLMMDALEAIGDRYGVYGFSGHGRDNVEFYVIKDLEEDFSAEVARRVGRVGPLHATRMGAAIRHTTSKLRQQQTRSKCLFLISDGRPQDRGYSQENSEKAYAVQDTRMALIEARREGIIPFCLTVDKEGNDYLRAMIDDVGYEVLADVRLLPRRLPQLYKRLTA